MHKYIDNNNNNSISTQSHTHTHIHTHTSPLSAKTEGCQGRVAEDVPPPEAADQDGRTTNSGRLRHKR